PHTREGGRAVDRVVAGQQADVVGAVTSDQVGVLLVRECLDRSRVEALAAGLERQVHRELADDGLAGTRWCGDQHAVAVLDDLAGLDLEVVERERVVSPERRQVRILPIGTGFRVSLGRGVHVSSLRGRAWSARYADDGANTFSAPGLTVVVIGSAPRRSPSPYATMPGDDSVTSPTRCRSNSGMLTCVPL